MQEAPSPAPRRSHSFWPVLFLTCLGTLAPGLTAHAKPLHLQGIPLPGRSVIQDDGTALSGRGFRKSTDFYQRYLDRNGLPHRTIGPYRYRRTTITRFLSDDPASRWLAIQVFQHRGRTWIAIIARQTP